MVFKSKAAAQRLCHHVKNFFTDSLLQDKLRLWDVQGDVKSPQQSQQLHQQVDDEPAVVPLSHTVPEPGTVVVETANAAFTRLTVPRSHGLLLETEKH